MPRQELENRVLDAVRDRILTPENVRIVVEAALEIVRREVNGRDGKAARQRLVRVETEIGNAARLAAHVGDVDAVARVIAELECERCQLVKTLADCDPMAFDDGALIRAAERWAADLRATLEGSPEECRRAFTALLGGRRMRVLADSERAFRVEGFFDLPRTYEAPPESVNSRGGISGSGGGI